MNWADVPQLVGTAMSIGRQLSQQMGSQQNDPPPPQTFSPPPPQNNEKREQGRWMFSAQTGWKYYSDPLQSEFDAQVANGVTHFDVMIHGVCYEIDLVRMIQINKEDRKKTRKIRREGESPPAFEYSSVAMRPYRSASPQVQSTNYGAYPSGALVERSTYRRQQPPVTNVTNNDYSLVHLNLSGATIRVDTLAKFSPR